MKPSRYNRVIDCCGKKFVYNAFTSALAEIDNNSYKYLTDEDACLEKIECSTKKAMHENGFIVSDSNDEVEMIRKRVAERRTKNRTSELLITLIPTLKCNYKCTYCYQDHSLRCGDGFHPDVENKILEIIDTSNAKKINLLWYGGEPTLYLDDVERVSKKILEICSRKQKQYYFSIITNGSKLTDENVKRLISCGVAGIQVTLDGPKEVHERRRVCLDSHANYDRIMSFLRNSQEYAGLNVQIRINIDKENINSIETLLAELSYLENKELMVSFARVEYFSDNCSNVQDMMFSSREFSQIERELIKIAKEFGLSVNDNSSNYPFAIESYCGATQGNSIIIDMSGNIYQCLSDSSSPSEAISNVFEVSDAEKLLDMCINSDYCIKSYDFENQCVECDVLPLCLGGCRLKSKLGKHECSEIKYSINRILNDYINNQMQKERN